MNQELGRKVLKLLESRRSLKIELLSFHQYKEEAIENKKRKAIVETYIKNAIDFLGKKSFKKGEISQMAENARTKIRFARNWNSVLTW